MYACTFFPVTYFLRDFLFQSIPLSSCSTRSTGRGAAKLWLKIILIEIIIIMNVGTVIYLMIETRTGVRVKRLR